METQLRCSRGLVGMGLVTCGLFAAALAGGCRQVLSFEDREYDPGSAGGGADGGERAEPTLDCDTYCDLIQSACTGQNQQFASPEACHGMCATYPPGTLFDDTSDTLGCRIHLLLQSRAMIESPECRAAGPGGEGVCGANCDSFCVSMMVVCPGSYADLEDCHRACSSLVDCHDYAVPASGAQSPDDPSLQCRIYHLSAAAQDLGSRSGRELTEPQTHHCPHAAGLTKCIPKDGATCN